ADGAVSRRRAALHLLLWLGLRCPPVGGRAECRNGSEHKRNQHVISGEREAKKAPRGLVAAYDREIGEGGQKVAAAGKIGQWPGAFLRARPPLPFDAGVKERKPRVEEHSQRDDAKSCG